MAAIQQQEEFFSSDCVPGFSVGATNSKDSDNLGFKFELSSVLLSFNNAQALCESRNNSQVASIQNLAEQNLMSLVVSQAPHNIEPHAQVVWIGLIDPVAALVSPTSDTSRFQWLDGSSFDFGIQPREEPWAETEPNNFENDIETCVE